MFHIGDKVRTTLRDIRAITSINEPSSGPSELMYGLDGGLTIWCEHEMTHTGEYEDYPRPQFNIGDEVPIGGETHRIEGIYLQKCYGQWVYRYRLRHQSGSRPPIARYEHELTTTANYTLF